MRNLKYIKADLEKYNPTMRKRVEHIITENKRVLMQLPR